MCVYIYRRTLDRIKITSGKLLRERKEKEGEGESCRDRRKGGGGGSGYPGEERGGERLVNFSTKELNLDFR